MNNFFNFCIICLKNNGNRRNIFDYDYDSMKILDKLQFCFVDMVYDNYHCLICTSCYEELQRLYAFKKMFEASKEQLKHFISLHAKILHEKETYVFPSPSISAQISFDENPTKDGATNTVVKTEKKPTKVEQEAPTIDSVQFRTAEMITENLNIKDEHSEVFGATKSAAAIKNCNEEETSAVLESSVTTVITKNVKKASCKECQDGPKPFTCKVCNRQFTQISSLRRHMVTHRGAEPHKCSICGQTFKAVSKLKLHMNLHSESEPSVCTLKIKVSEPNKCAVCGKVFTQRALLKKHMVVHSGAKLYSCFLCGKEFSQKSSLDRHMIVHVA